MIYGHVIPMYTLIVDYLIRKLAAIAVSKYLPAFALLCLRKRHLHSGMIDESHFPPWTT